MYPLVPGFSLQEWEEVAGGKVWVRLESTAGKKVQCTPFGEFSQVVIWFQNSDSCKRTTSFILSFVY